MYTAVVYDSEFGNTRKLAEAIATVFQEIGTVRVTDVRSESFEAGSKPDLLIVGGPTQVHGVSAPLRAQLDGLAAGSLAGVPVATFDTRVHGPSILTGAAAQGIAKRLTKRGARLVREPMGFLVDGREGPLTAGELQRAEGWARGIMADVLELLTEPAFMN